MIDKKEKLEVVVLAAVIGKLTKIFIVLFIFAGCAQNSVLVDDLADTDVILKQFVDEKRYEIESVILKMRAVAKAVLQDSEKEATNHSVHYIADFGRKELKEITLGHTGQFLTNLLRNGYVFQTTACYQYNNVTIQGFNFKYQMTYTDGNFRHINFLNLTDEVRILFNIEERENEMFLGKDCRRYDLTYIPSIGERPFRYSVWVWNGLILKAISETYTAIAEVTSVEEVTEIIVNADIAMEKFEIPDVEFVER